MSIWPVRRSPLRPRPRSRSPRAGSLMTTLAVVPAVVLAVALVACSGAAPPSPASVGPSALALASPSPSPAASPALSPAPSPSVAPSAAAPASPRPSPVPIAALPVSNAFPPTTLGSPAPQVSHGSRAYPVIAITIDDGFSSAAVLADLAILQRERVNATWFPIGRVVEAAPATWRTVAAAGFPIANHTYDHGFLTRYDYARIVADIKRDAAVVSAIIGRPLLPFVRPLGGSWNGTVLAAAAAAGERAVVLWDITTGDSAALPGRSNVDLLVRNATRGTNGSIILMHANQPYTQQALPRIIASYRERGFEFVTLGQMFGVDGPVPFPTGTPLPGPSARPSPAPAPARHPS